MNSFDSQNICELILFTFYVDTVFHCFGRVCDAKINFSLKKNDEI